MWKTGKWERKNLCFKILIRSNPPTSLENNPEAQFIMTPLLVVDMWSWREWTGNRLLFTWFIPADHLQNLKNAGCTIIRCTHQNFFPDFFWWLSAWMIFILWTSAFYHIESSICRWYFGWEIFIPTGNRGSVPRAILPGALQKRGCPHWISRFYWKLIRYSSNYATASMRQILIGTAEGSRIQWGQCCSSSD